jgi:hypothetical protein
MYTTFELFSVSAIALASCYLQNSFIYKQVKITVLIFPATLSLHNPQLKFN